MKNWNFGVLVMALIVTTFFVSCNDDEDPAVKGSITVTVSGLPTGAVADIMVSGPNDFSQTLTASAELTDLSVGVYEFEVAAVENDGSRYITSETTLTVNITDDTPETLGIEFAEWSTVNGIVGTWVSAGDDVAVLLTTYFSVDSIVATFKADQTYEVLQYAGGSTTALTLEGTYSQTASSTGNIWTIQVDQTSPSTLTSEGIFEVTASDNPNSMQYEIVQTTPDIGALAPTPEDGFGSTSAGAYGTTNIQVYKRRSY
jgi:hypothetical protein